MSLCGNMEPCREAIVGSNCEEELLSPQVLVLMQQYCVIGMAWVGHGELERLSIRFW